MRMKKTKQQLEKITKYSIRKLTVGVGPVAIGAFLFGASPLSVDKVQANEVGGAHSVHYRYLAEQELTESEKALIHHEVPTEFQDDDILYVVYRKRATNSQQLPYTGSKEVALAGLGLATASLAVFLVSKKGRKEVLGVLLIGSLGASTFVPYGTFAFENKELLSYNQTISASTHEGLTEGIIHIDGYEYIGYFKEAELHPSRPASDEKHQLPVEKQSSKEIEKTEVAQETPAVTPESAVEKPLVENPVAPAVEEKPVSEKSQTRQEESLVEIPFETITSPDANLAEGQTRIVTAGVKGQRRLVTKVSMVNGQEVREVIQDQVVQNSVSQVIAVGTKKEVQPAPTPVPQPEFPEYHEAKGVQEVKEGEKQGETLVQPVLPEYQEAKGTQEEDRKGQALTQPELPEYKEPVSTKGTQEPGQEGQAPVQEVNPEYKVTTGTVEKSTESELDFTTEVVPDDTKYVDEEVVETPGSKGVQVTKTTYETVEGEETDKVLSTTTEVKTPAVSKVVKKGTKPLEGKTVEIREEVIPFATKEQEDDTLKRGTRQVAQKGVEGKKQITETYKTIRGEKTNEAPTVEETVLQAPQDEIIKKGTKGLEKPTLEWAKTEKDVLKKSATATYTLNKQAGVEIKSIKVALKDKAGQVVKEVRVEENNLNATLDNLKYYQGYTLSTTMVYDRGEGEETETLKDKEVQLDLKKVEIKNIKETSLMSVDDAGVETDKSLLTEKPTDVAPLYLRVTTHDNKTTRLAVSSVEEVVVDGKTLYKVVAKAPDLVQRRADDTLSEEYVHYFEKQKAKVGNVYYNFKELIEDMQKDPTGEFKLGADLNAVNVPTPSKQYVTGTFKGKLSSEGDNRFTIHNLARPLFNRVENAHIHDFNLGNVDINMPWANKTAPLGEMFKKSTIENIKVTGNVVGNNDVTGMVNKLDESNMRNVAFIGNITSVGNAGWWSGGLVSESWRSNTDNSYIDAYIKGNKAKVGGLIAKLNHGDNPMDVSAWGRLKNSVAKGTIDVKESLETGGLLHSNWSWGLAENNVTMMKVKNGGEILYGSRDAEDDDYFGANWVRNNNVFVNGVSEGKQSYSRSSRWKGVSQEEADARIAKMGITAHEYTITEHFVDKLNHKESKSDTYKSTQDYDASRELAYRNIEKLQPFYNKEWIIDQGNKLAADSHLMTKEVLSVTAMKGNAFVTELADADHILVHYADKTKDIFTVSPKDSKVKQVKEYSIAELGEVVYTPNMVDKDRSDLINAIVEKLSPVELQSDPIYQKLGRTGPNKVNAIKDLYLEESFKEVKNNLAKFVKQLLENEDHQLNTDEAAKRSLIKKIDDNKAAVLLGLSYLNRYYGVKFDNFNIKQLMLFKPDFYGKNVNVLDRLIEIGSKEDYVKGSRTQDAFREVIAKNTRSGNLIDFLAYNMELFTSNTNLNDWFIHSTEGKVYVVEKQSREEGLKSAKYRAFDNLSRGYHQKMILPLLNLTDTEAFLISTYNTLSFGTANKYGKSMADVKSEIDLAASRHINYLDFWYRLANDNVKNLLAKDIVTPVWEGYKVWGHEWPSWMDRYGNFDDGKGIYAPVRELYGPVGEYYGHNGAMAGAYATYYDNKNDNRHKVVFVMSDMLTEYGASAFTHETTHVNDRVAYFGGHGHREGTFVEAFAQGMLQSAATQGHQGEYGALGLNMAFERPNDGNQWYNTNPNDLKSREEIDRYMKGFNDTLMLLDYLEGEAVLDKHSKELNNAWFKKVDRQLRNANTKHQFDKVRPLNDAEKAIQLNTVNDLVMNNFMTNRGPGNGVYNPSDFGSAYVNVPIMTGIYGGNTSEGSPGAMSFKHNTFRIWGYFGYEKGFVGFVSNKYKQESKKAGKETLGDDFIINKISEGKFNNLEDWKKAYFNEVVTSAKNGIQSIEIDGKTYNSYEDLKRAFAEAVDKDKATLSNGSVKFDKTVSLKEKLFKKLLQQTDSFKASIFK